MGIIGYIAAAAYLIVSFNALLTIKGFAWAIGATITGVIAFFPIWAYFILDYSNNLIWILFLICIVDAIVESKKRWLNWITLINYQRREHLNYTLVGESLVSFFIILFFLPM